MSVLTTKPQFLYPHSRQFPFDEVAEKIVRAIEKRNWKVPGLTIEFDTYGSGEAKYQMIRTITGDSFKLYFCRVQGRLDDRWNDTAALHSICIPKQILEVFEDESGPSYYLYVGKNWDSDKDWFMNSIKVNSKLNKETRRYLRYNGNIDKKGTKQLIADNDLGREYSPIGDEPVSINLEKKINEITAWLKEFVLNYILIYPEKEKIQPPIPMEEIIPYNGPWNTIYSICDCGEARRIQEGIKNPSKLPPYERHASFGWGTRLVPLDVHCNDRFPEIAYEGFIWCDIIQEEVSKNTQLTDEVVYAMGGSSIRNRHIVAINLKYANQVYVADNYLYVETRQQLIEAIKPRIGLTYEELGNAFAARGATIVPITEYKGDYKEAIVLIARELEFEEIEKIFYK